MTNFDTKIETYDDGEFTIFKTRFGMFQARDKEGNGLCSGLDKDSVAFWAREHLNGYANSYASTTNVSMLQDSLK